MPIPDFVKLHNYVEEQQAKGNYLLGVDEVMLDNPKVKASMLLNILYIKMNEKEYIKVYSLFKKEAKHFRIFSIDLDTFVKSNGKKVKHNESILCLTFRYTGNNKNVIEILKKRNKLQTYGVE